MPRVSGSAWPWLLADDSDAIVGVRSGNIDQLFVFSNDDALNIDMSNLAATWNASGTTFTAVKMNVTDTASAAGSLLLDLQVGGVSRFSVRKDGAVTMPAVFFQIGNDIGLNYNAAGAITLNPAGSYNWGSASLNSPDLFLFRDAANTLAQRNGTNAQAFRIYNTYTDASNYERGVFDWANNPNTLTIGTQQAGTGSARSLRLITQGDANLLFITNNVTRFDVSSAGLRATANLLWTADNTYDIGASGATRPRNVFVGTAFYGPAWYGGTAATSPGLISGSNSLTLDTYAAGNFSRLNFGGTTSSFPALKRNSTALETKLADDSAYAPHAMQYLDITDGITAPAAATGRARIYVDTADGDLKVIFADGTIKTIVTDT
jgi:hypothetical protein